MTPLQFAQYIRKETFSNPTTLPDADILLYAGIRMDQIAARLVKYDEDYFGAPQLTDLVNNQREYPFPSDMLNHIKKVEAKLDGVNWINLKEMDLAQYEFTTDEATITSYFGNTQDSARYFIYRGSLWLLSGTLSGFSAGNYRLKLWSYEWPTHISDLTSQVDISQDPNNTSAGFPKVLHQSLADGIVIDYKMSADKPLQLDDRDINWERNLEKNLATLTELNKDRTITASFPSNNGLYGNGFRL